MKTTYSQNRFHLGDNLIFLHLLRALTKQHPDQQFIHFCHGIDQLAEVVEDLPNIILFPFTSPLWKQVEHRAVDTWKNADSHWEKSPVRWDWSAHTLAHHAWTAKRMGYESPFSAPHELLFDYPALDQIPEWAKEGHIEHDFLVVNAEPGSGQFGPMKQHGVGYLDEFVRALAQKNRVLTTEPVARTSEHHRCTRRENMSISRIGAVSRICRHVIGIFTGPLWPCMSTHRNHTREGQRNIALLDNGEKDFPLFEQVETVEQLFAIAEKEGWI